MASASAKTARSGDKIVPKKQSLFDDSASSSEDDQEDGGATLAGQTPGLKINEEYARRFEHNKKREELHRLQEKYGAGEESESSSDDESEDDEAALITEDLDAEISATLAAIKNKDPRIYDKEAVFYKPFDPATDGPKEDEEKKEKPMFLRDYHRERYMAGDVGADDDTAANPNVPRTYVQEQAELKNAIMAEINNAAGADDEEWSDDDAFIKPVKKEEPAPAANGVHPSRVAHVEVTELDVKNADKNPEEFLSKFMASKAWAPDHKWQAFDSDEEDGEDDIADEFEHAYNMRFEDPTKSNEVLKTYSRNMANARSARKEELTGRKKLRALEKERKEAEKKQKEAERARLRRLKVEEASERLKKIKQAAGMSGKQLTDEEWVEFLDKAWDDDHWEEEMKKRFNDDYYKEADDMLIDSSEEEASGSEDEDGKKKKKSKKPKKPKWDDDIDIKDIIPDFKEDEEEVAAIALSDLEADQPAPSVEGSDSDSDDSDRPAKKRKTTKDLKKEKAAAKKAARAELAKIEALVDTKMEIEQPRALSKSKGKEQFTFKYRETSPTSFGLTARDILLAPSDAALNEFAGLKKLASFRDAEKKKKDKKKLGKKARLRQWRRDTFGKEYEESGPTYGFEKLLDDGKDKKKKEKGSGANSVKVEKKGGVKVKEGEKEQEKVVVDGIVEGERRKKRKRSKKGKAEE
ncbi:KRI1-like family-domain-containing protein [Cercophora samala]|uniref:KRI1-like family-domain-containing protein n=1 Tax=Cercophora samala TaxID=330535 RepID=A0AA39YLN8_9PEZI|nr:KRI1-like family-domain-containing protein [Cercophora samala]